VVEQRPFFLGLLELVVLETFLLLVLAKVITVEMPALDPVVVEVVDLQVLEVQQPQPQLELRELELQIVLQGLQ
jgi:hypothetical protein